MEDWKQVVRNEKFPKCIENANLWVDSVEFPRIGKKSVSPQSDKWSYKCNRPGIKYQVHLDGNIHIRKLFGWMSPKLSDKTWCKLKKTWSEKHLKGAVVLADQHYHNMQKHYKNSVWKIAVESEVSKSKKKKKKGTRVLTKEQQELNDAIYETRARIECLFGIWQNTFKSLKEPFAESKSQHDHLVWTVAGLHNYTMA